MALKIQKSASQYTDAAEDEVQLLGVIKERADEENCEHFVVQLLDRFYIYGPNGKHMCMVFEVCGENLLSLIKRYDYRGIPLELVKIIALHSLIGIDFLHRKCSIIHTDLKPENVLMMPTEPFNLQAVQAERNEVVAREVAERLEKAKQKLANQQLSKNQKKRLKAKLKKEAEKQAQQLHSGAEHHIHKSHSKLSHEEEKHRAKAKGLDNVNARRDASNAPDSFIHSDNAEERKTHWCVPHLCIVWYCAVSSCYLLQIRMYGTFVSLLVRLL